ncbi:hypothetical protein [Dokdonia sinensis]|nr:hypothetical protein [Dokdonia sinensis]
MKTILLSLSLALLFMAQSCKDDDDSPQESIDQLPPITQTGEQTLGCLINGEPWVPSGFGNSAPRAFYQFVDGAFTLGISGSMITDEKLVGLNIGALEIQELNEEEYALVEFEPANFFGRISIDGGLIFTASTNSSLPGKLTISHFDQENFIISGSFEFTVRDEEGETYEITEGRFDLNYTN